MDRRQSPRVQVQLPVQVWGMDAHGRGFTAPALVTNLSSGGLVLQGITRRIRIGEVIEVLMGRDKAQFRVIWIGPTGEMGMQQLTSQAFFSTSVLSHCCQPAVC